MFGMFAILQLTSAMHAAVGRSATGNMNLQKEFDSLIEGRMNGITVKQRMLQSMIECPNTSRWGARCDMHETSTIADVKKTISDDKYSTFYCKQCQDKARSMTKEDL